MYFQLMVLIMDLVFPIELNVYQGIIWGLLFVWMSNMRGWGVGPFQGAPDIGLSYGIKRLVKLGSKVIMIQS